MKSKLYLCENPECSYGKPIPIRSTIKEGPYKGLKVCQICKQRLEVKILKEKVATKFKSNPKTLEKRKAERVGLPSFFALMAEELVKRPICENCGCNIDYWIHPYNNLAHVLMKSKYKSVMLEPNNILFLCALKDSNGAGCHEKFDSSISTREKMDCFAIAKEKYLLFRDQVLEYGSERSSLEK